MEKPKAMDSEEEKRRRERRNRDGKSRSKRPPGHRLDVIDKLDVTSIFGTGCKFFLNRDADNDVSGIADTSSIPPRWSL